jgi:D-alanyl-lipoteichoic acid acyltransferase DltB (MBOAT superfamily)
MLFQSQAFILLFLPAVLAAYYALADRAAAREKTLIVASLLFYGWWDPRFLPLLIGQTVLTWLIAEGHLRFPSKSWIVFGVAANLAVLALFKYTLFLAGSVAGFLGVSTPGWDFILPLGISFYTFELISYLVDLDRGKGHHYPLRQFCLFIFLFPHLIAGPIIRHNEIIPQFSQSPLRRGLSQRFGLGIAFFVVGCVKKVFLADGLAGIVDAIFATQHTPALSDAWLGALAFTFQLFLDFSAYSEMAIGLGLMFGFRFPDNFDVPYRATSLRDFWRRWHMTLSRFLRDYLYIPLGGSRHGTAVYVKATIITMGLCGLWHGAGWTFVAWGLMHGLGLIACRFWQRSGRQLATPLAWAVTMLFVIISWVLFRAGDFASAGKMLAGMIGLGGLMGELAWPPVLAAAAVVSLLGPSTREFVETRLQPLPAYGIAFGLVAVVTLLQVGQGQPQSFIYFQF